MPSAATLPMPRDYAAADLFLPACPMLIFVIVCHAGCRCCFFAIAFSYCPSLSSARRLLMPILPLPPLSCRHKVLFAFSFHYFTTLPFRSDSMMPVCRSLAPPFSPMLAALRRCSRWFFRAAACAADISRDAIFQFCFCAQTANIVRAYACANKNAQRVCKPTQHRVKMRKNKQRKRPKNAKRWRSQRKQRAIRAASAVDGFSRLFDVYAAPRRLPLMLLAMLRAPVAQLTPERRHHLAAAVTVDLSDAATFRRRDCADFRPAAFIVWFSFDFAADISRHYAAWRYYCCCRCFVRFAD